MKYLTWDDLADFYHRKTGGKAKIRPMQEIYDWAIKQPEITETPEGLILKADNLVEIDQAEVEKKLLAKLAPTIVDQLESRDPLPKVIHKNLDGKWYYWDETWSFEEGPFDSEEIAKENLNSYCKEILDI